MGDVPEKPEPERPAPRLDREALGANVRRVLTGMPDRPVRRSVLFLIAAGGIGIAMTVDSVVPSVIALIAVMLLALTDNVVVEL